MLNYIWVTLILLGLIAALSFDIKDSSSDEFRNGKGIPVTIRDVTRPSDGTQRKFELSITAGEFERHFEKESKTDVILQATTAETGVFKSAGVYLKIEKQHPQILKTMAKASAKEDDLNGTLTLKGIADSMGVYKGVLLFESISFLKLREVVSAALDYSSKAVEIAIGLIGIMALWLGIMKIAEQAGIINYISSAVRPITRILFPDVPANHPAIGSIIMNFSANFLGLGNAATPFGIKAMEELDSLNPEKGTATNAMCTFLAINTAGMTLIPATAIALRAAAGSSDPAIIIGTSIFGSTCATITGVMTAKILENFPLNGRSIFSVLKEKIGFIIALLVLIAIICFLAFSGVLRSEPGVQGGSNTAKTIIELVSTFAIPVIIFTFLLIGFMKKVKLYEQFVEGAKEGFNVAIRIIPYLVAMLAAIGIFRASGAMEWMIYLLRFVTDPIGMPGEALPMALMRPLSGSGSLGIMAEIMSVHGPDSFIGILTSTFFGSSETTFYVLAVYFGAVNVKRTRHALAAGLMADVAGALGALFIVKMLFG